MKNKSPNLSSVGHLLRLFRDFTKRAFLKSSTVISQDDTAVKLYKRTANGRHRSPNNLPLPSNTETVEGIFAEKNLCTLTLSVCTKLVCWFLNTGVTPKPCCVWANLVCAFVYTESLCLSKSCGALPRRVWNDPYGWKPFQTTEGTQCAFPPKEMSCDLHHSTVAHSVKLFCRMKMYSNRLQKPAL